MVPLAIAEGWDSETGLIHRAEEKWDPPGPIRGEGDGLCAL